MAEAARTAAPVLPLWRIRARRKLDPDIAAALDRCHEYPFEKIGAFYAWVEENLGKKEKAYLDKIDRYYLLLLTLKRSDALDHGPKGNRWLYERCREVEAEPDGCLDLWARYHYKSSIITFAGIIQEILRDPEITIGLFSFTNKIAKGFLGQIKLELETNETLRLRHDDVLWWEPKKQAPKWSVDDGIIVKRRTNPKEATVSAFGLVDGQPTSKHFKLRVYDDVWTRDNVTTPEQITKTQEARELSENLTAHGGRQWNIGTRYSFADGYGMMIDRGIVKVRIYPATHNGKLEGEPVFLTPEEWADIKRKQPSTIAAQMLQNPTAGKDKMFRLAWNKPYWVRPRTLNVYILGDPSKGSPNRRSDNTSISVIGIDSANNRYILDGYRHRMRLTARWTALKTLHKKWKRMPGVLTVQVGYEQYGLQTDLEHFQDKMRQENYHFAIKEVGWTRDHTMSKADRVERLVPDLQGGNWFVPAVVWAGGRLCQWVVDEETDAVSFKPLDMDENGQQRPFVEPAQWRHLRESGQTYRIPLPIKRADEDNQIYDLTACWFEEMTYFPFGNRDDFLDSASRLYDMEPVAPRIIDPKDIEPGVYVDT